MAPTTISYVNNYNVIMISNRELKIKAHLNQFVFMEYIRILWAWW